MVRIIPRPFSRLLSHTVRKLSSRNISPPLKPLLRLLPSDPWSSIQFVVVAVPPVHPWRLQHCEDLFGFGMVLGRLATSHLNGWMRHLTIRFTPPLSTYPLRIAQTGISTYRALRTILFHPQLRSSVAPLNCLAVVVACLPSRLVRIYSPALLLRSTGANPPPMAVSLSVISQPLIHLAVTTGHTSYSLVTIWSTVTRHAPGVT